MLYGAFYVSDQPQLRSACWGLGLACVLGLFFTAARLA